MKPLARLGMQIAEYRSLTEELDACLRRIAAFEKAGAAWKAREDEAAATALLLRMIEIENESIKAHERQATVFEDDVSTPSPGVATVTERRPKVR